MGLADEMLMLETGNDEKGFLEWQRSVSIPIGSERVNADLVNLFLAVIFFFRPLSFSSQNHFSSSISKTPTSKKKQPRKNKEQIRR